MEAEFVIEQSSMTYMGMTGMIWILLPVAVCIYAAVKLKTGPIPVFIGAGTFFIAQMLLRSPLLTVLYSLPGMQNWAISNPTMSAFFLSLTAGIFEEGARLAVFMWILNRRRSRNDGIVFGLGHGGLEALLIVGLGNINNLITAAAYTSNAHTALEPEAARQVIDAAQILSQVTGYEFIAANLERVFAICLHIALSLLVLYAVREKKWSFLGAAVTLHTLSNFGAVLLSSLPMGLLWSEAFLCAVAVISVMFAYRIKSYMKD